MISQEDEHRAQEARRLLNEPLLAEALKELREEALEALVDTEATNTAEIQKLQAVAKVTLDLVIRLNRYLLPLQAQATGENEQPTE